MEQLSRRGFLKVGGLGVAMLGAGTIPSFAAQAKR